MNKIDKKLVEAVATLLACKDATEPNFMWEVADALKKRGYDLVCIQRGISGTFVSIEKLNSSGAQNK